VHATLRVRAGLPSLRDSATRRALEAALARCSRGGFRLVHYSIQTNHLHLIAEVDGERARAVGMSGLVIRLARALNRVWRRSGCVFEDRYHDHVLRTPREARNALAYVLRNAVKHRSASSGVDPFSSGRWFDGWIGGGSACERSSEPAPVQSARTWLLTVGWRRHGLIDASERPEAKRLARGKRKSSAV
jgi:REP element-mobilizing transposase RayT